MKKNGFTLIELLAAIMLLAVLSTITINIAVKKINETKEKGKETLIKSIELAAKSYIIDNGDTLDSFIKNDYIYLSLETLIKEEKLTNSLVDPTTKTPLPLSDTVYVTRSTNGKITSVYDINQKNKTKLVLNGSYNIYIKKGSIFTDPGVVATSNNGENVEATVSGNVNTDVTGNYVLKYTHGDNSITRNVIVY